MFPGHGDCLMVNHNQSMSIMINTWFYTLLMANSGDCSCDCIYGLILPLRLVINHRLGNPAFVIFSSLIL